MFLSKSHLQLRSYVLLCCYYSWPKPSSSLCNSVTHSNPAWFSMALKSPIAHSTSWEDFQDQRSVYAEMIHNILRKKHIANSLTQESCLTVVHHHLTFCTRTGVSIYRSLPASPNDYSKLYIFPPAILNICFNNLNSTTIILWGILLLAGNISLQKVQNQDCHQAGFLWNVWLRSQTATNRRDTAVHWTGISDLGHVSGSTTDCGLLEKYCCDLFVI